MMKSVTIDCIRDGSVSVACAVVSEDTYTGDFDALLRGEEVPCGWDEETGEPIAWDILHEE